jgi:zinc transport system substrate-binding protein
VALGLLLSLVLALATGPTLAQAQPPVDVLVSILPQRFIVERVGGERVRVTVLVGPGQTPATFEPSPRQITAVGRARLYFRIGVGFEHAWLPRLRAINPRLEVLDQRDGLPLRGEPAGHGHRHGDGEDLPGDAHAGTDPHVWTSPRLVNAMASQVRDTLARLDPPGRPDYDRRLATLRAELDGLDREVRSILEPVQGRRFLVFHPTWGYFADEYGLEQVAIEHEGKEPGARRLGALIDDARARGIRAVFVQRQYSATAAQTVARAIGARVVELDPLSDDYVANTRRVAQAFRDALE